MGAVGIGHSPLIAPIGWHEGGGVRNNPAVPKWCKTIIAILLLPVCVGGGWALWRVLRASGEADTTWVPFLAGAACWVVIYLLLPKPMRVYVFGHELTHVLWTWLHGGRVKKFKVSAKGGHVVVTKSNFAIALAPYFFPLYAILIMLLFLAGHWLWNWSHYLVWFHLLLGRRLRLPRDPELAHPQTQPDGHQRPGLPLLGGSDLSRQRGRIAGGDSLARAQGGRADRARLVAGMHR